MKTTYLTSITTAFNPFSRTAAVPRLFLQQLSPKAQKDIKIVHQVLSRTPAVSSTLSLGFKDGQKMDYQWAETQRIEGQKPEKQTQLGDIIDAVERHARILSRKEELAG